MGRGDDIIAVMFMSRKKVVAVLAVLGIAGGFLWWWNVDGHIDIIYHERILFIFFLQINTFCCACFHSTLTILDIISTYDLFLIQNGFFISRQFLLAVHYFSY